MTKQYTARAPEFSKATRMDLSSCCTGIDITNSNNKTLEILQMKKDQNSSSKITTNIIQVAYVLLLLLVSLFKCFSAGHPVQGCAYARLVLLQLYNPCLNLKMNQAPLISRRTRLLKSWEDLQFNPEFTTYQPYYSYKVNP